MFAFLIALLLSAGTSLNLSAQQNTIELSTKSDEARLFFILGRDLYENHEYKAAAELFEKAFSLDPNFLSAEIYHALVNQNRKELYKIKEHVKELGKISTSDMHLLSYAEGLINNDRKMMLKSLTDLYNLFPEDARTNFYLGMYHTNIDLDYLKARLYLEKAIELDKNFAIAYNSLGYACMGDDNCVTAENAFKKYIELKPHLANPYDSYAEYLLNFGRVDQAIINYKKSISYSSEFSASLIGLGKCYALKREYEKAKKFFERITPNTLNKKDYYEAQRGLAYLFLIEGNIEKSIATLKTTFDFCNQNELHNEAAGLLAQLAQIMSEHQQVKEGAENYKLAINYVNTLNESTLNKDRRLWTIYQYAYSKQIEKAWEEFRKLDQSEYGENYHAIQGFLYAINKEYEKAISHFEKASTNPLYDYYAGISCQKTGKEKKAQLFFNKIKSYLKYDINYALYLNKLKS